MKVSVNCPECGVGNVINGTEHWTEENLTKIGSKGTKPCQGCGRVFTWYGDQLIKSTDEVGLTEKKSVKK